MSTERTADGDGLLDRAASVIAESARLRGEVQRSLERAILESTRLTRSLSDLGALRPRAAAAWYASPWPPPPLRALRPAEVIRREDAELEKAWRRILPAIETPLRRSLD